MMLDEQRAQIITECWDPMLFLRTFLPHWFSKPVSWAHRGAMALLLGRADFLTNFGTEHWPDGDYEWTAKKLQKIIRHFVWRKDPFKPEAEDNPEFPLFEYDEETGELHFTTSQFIQLIWPRGFGKTTLLNAANIIKTVYRLEKFIVYLSESGAHAGMQLANIQSELEGNNLLIEVFGQQKAERNEPEKWTETLFETKGGVTYTARGRGGQVRGLLHKNARPTQIIVDDVEDAESVSTDLQRDKVLRWFMADVVPALNQITGDGSIVMIGTILHNEALLLKVAGDPQWVTVVLGAIDRDGEALWHEYMTIEQFEVKRLSYARVGMLEEFYREFLSLLRNSKTAKFPGPFKIQIMRKEQFVARALALDPAISDDQKKADYVAYGVTGMTERGLHHVLDVYAEKGMMPRDIIDKYFELHFKWDTTHNGIEAVAFQAVLVALMREEMFRKAKKFGTKAYFEIIPIRHGTKNKLRRVEGVLAPRYAAGYFSHQEAFPLLTQQLLDWPNGKRDLPDAVAMATVLLEPFAALAFDPTKLNPETGEEEPTSLEEDMYQPLPERESAI